MNFKNKWIKKNNDDKKEHAFKDIDNIKFCWFSQKDIEILKKLKKDGIDVFRWKELDKIIDK